MKLKAEPFKMIARLERIPGEVHGRLKKQILKYIRNESHYQEPQGFNDFKQLLLTDAPPLPSYYIKPEDDVPAPPKPKVEEPKPKKPKVE